MNRKGQVSLFLGITLAVVMALIAFVINVGMFVKAKINLQNAVDAAAWAGAATQARQLTNIAHLNWEMRNTYKEWMFKYYVLGTLGVDALRGAPAARTNFRLQPFYRPGEENYDPKIYDRFNVPSICIHYGSPHNICGTAMVPGLPRFNSVGLPSISEYHESLLNAIVREKASDCSDRTKINFGAAMTWAFGVGNRNLFPGVPQIAGHRTGAWVEAMELALRMRNLEMIVNAPPISDGVCAPGGECATNVEDLANSPLHERTVKAFSSAFRNLSGGDREFAKTLVLKEIAPTPFVASPASLSGFLIPPGNALNKHYLDLQAYPLNLVTFYTTFTSDSGEFKNNGTVTGDEARCAGSKTALPVPGYILGLVKNPEVMTYYAVKGEAKFVGLFFPFADRSGLKLTAYASAKPFGGKIGPRLFSIAKGSSAVRARNEASATRTGPYVSGLNTQAFEGRSWDPMFPMPFDPQFWILGPSQAVGGTPKSGNEIYFGVPNLIYDFEQIGDIAGMNSGNVIETIQPARSEPEARVVVETMGLYDGKQYQKFRSNLATPQGIVMSAEEVNTSLDSVRRPTRYEAMNYLIPTASGPDPGGNIDTQHQVPPGKSQYVLYAPLFGPQTLYQDRRTITNTVSEYLDYIRPATQKYLDALKTVADDMRAKSATTRGRDAYIQAAATIYREPLTPNPSDCNSLSMAQIFHQHFNGTSEVCTIVPIQNSLETYFGQRAGSEARYQNFYIPPYTPSESVPTKDLMAAYFPGPRQGASPGGDIQAPFPGIAPRLSKRNYYSTKFFALEKIMQGGDNPYGRIPLYLERNDLGHWPTDLQGMTILNTLPSAGVGEFGSNPPH